MLLKAVTDITCMVDMVHLCEAAGLVGTGSEGEVTQSSIWHHLKINLGAWTFVPSPKHTQTHYICNLNIFVCPRQTDPSSVMDGGSHSCADCNPDNTPNAIHWYTRANAFPFKSMHVCTPAAPQPGATKTWFPFLPDGRTQHSAAYTGPEISCEEKINHSVNFQNNKIPCLRLISFNCAEGNCTFKIYLYEKTNCNTH